MTLPRIHWTLPALAAALTLAACGGAHQSEAVVSPQPSPKGDVAAIAKAKADSARYPYTEADVNFMSAMIGHHAQALQMAALAPTHGASPSVRILAERIVNGQQDEILTMQRWLSDRRKPLPEAGANRMKMHGHQMLMPGMLTEAQMRQLDEAKGPEFDRLFLTFMIQHHRGAVTMVKDLFASRGAARDETVFKFANDVSVDQSTEIERMEKMLGALGSSTGSP